MKRWRGLISLTICAAMLSVPAYAAKTLYSDTFSSGSKLKAWEVDRYEPDSFTYTKGLLELAIGKQGYSVYRPNDQRTAYYNLQGMKLPVPLPPSTTWSASVKLHVGDDWFNSSESRRAEFRVDLIDKDGNKVAQTPAIALSKPSSQSAHWEYYNANSKSKWSKANTFVNGDGDREDVELEDDWQTLIIRCDRGVITYYVGPKKIGSCAVDTRNIYPEYIALNANNYMSAYEVEWDNVALYDGIYTSGKLRTAADQREYEEKMEEKYEKKREKWYASNTLYKDPTSREWKTLSSWEGKGFDEATIQSWESKYKKNMPDSLWDY